MVRVGLVVTVLSVVLAGTGWARTEDHVARVMGEGFEGLFIAGVPDESQPPPNPLGFPTVDDWCAPIAAANAVVFLDHTVEAAWARRVSGGLSPGELSAYLGYFMATNGEGSRERLNASSQRPGTLSADIAPGLAEFAEWPGEPPPGLMTKECYAWRVDFLDSECRSEALMEAYAASIEAGIPAILCFSFWNPMDPTPLTLSSTMGEAVPVSFCAWGDPITSSTELQKEEPKTPDESWDEKWGIGHAVTGVGVVKDRERLWAIVHDNWSTTAENVAVPWSYVVALIRLLPI